MIRHGLLADLLPVAQTEKKFAVVGVLNVEPLHPYKPPLQPYDKGIRYRFYGEGEPDGYRRLREALW